MKLTNILKILLSVSLLVICSLGYCASEQADGTSASGAAWAGATNALTDDGNSASTACGAAITDYLIIYDFSTSIPGEATIDGIVIREDGFYATCLGDDCARKEHRVSISNDGSTYSSEKTKVFSTSESTYSYGSSTDKWGLKWQPSDFGSNFKIRIRANRLNCGPNGIQQKCEYLSRTVYYTPGQIVLRSLSDIIKKCARFFNNRGMINIGRFVYLLHPQHKYITERIKI